MLQSFIRRVVGFWTVKGSKSLMFLAAMAFLLSLQAFAVVPTYTGCYSASSGTINKLALGTSPQKACNSGDILVSFSSGDVTKISVSGGLTGGGDNGDITISLNPAYSLPQSCSANFIAKWTGSAWSCAADENTTYTNGTGISLSGADNAFSIVPAYRLPQGCGNGSILKVTAGGWGCAAAASGKPHAYAAASDDVFLINFTPYNVVTLTLPTGQYMVYAKVKLTNGDNSSQGASCSLLVDGVEKDAFDTRLGDGIHVGDMSIAHELNLPLVTWGTVNSTVTMTCKSFQADAYGAITAIPVDGIN